MGALVVDLLDRALGERSPTTPDGMAGITVEDKGADLDIVSSIKGPGFGEYGFAGPPFIDVCSSD